MKFKGVQGGTPTGPPLCRTCHFCVRIQGKAESQTMIFCRAISDFETAKPLPFEAYECTDYEDKRLPSLRNLEKEAWILSSDTRTKKVGFVSPLQKEEHKKLLGNE